MTRFVIDLGDVKLSREAQQELTAELQSVALGKVAADGAGSIVDKPFAIRFPIEWQGLILRDQLEDILKVEKQIAEFGQNVR